MIAVRLPSRCLSAQAAASHTEPSLISPSPMSTTTRLSRLWMRAASASPIPMGRPWPSAQDVVIEHTDYLDERERRSDVAALALVDRADDQPAQMAAALVERLFLHPPEIGGIGRFDRVVHAPRRHGTLPAHALGNRPL